jgi:hypothetical protein
MSTKPLQDKMAKFSYSDKRVWSRKLFLRPVYAGKLQTPHKSGLYYT